MEDYPLNTIKGKICTQTYIHEFDDVTANIKFIMQPKIILLNTGKASLMIDFQRFLSKDTSFVCSFAYLSACLFVLWSFFKKISNFRMIIKVHLCLWSIQSLLQHCTGDFTTIIHFWRKWIFQDFSSLSYVFGVPN